MPVILVSFALKHGTKGWKAATQATSGSETALVSGNAGARRRNSRVFALDHVFDKLGLIAGTSKLRGSKA